MSDDDLSTFHHRYRRIGRIAKVGYWEWDDNTDKLTAVSGQFARLIGLTRESLLAAPSALAALLETVHPDDHADYLAMIEKTKVTPEPYVVEFRSVRPNGEVRRLVEMVEPEIKNGSHTGRWYGVTQDVTALRTGEAELRKRDTDQKLAAEIADLGYWEYDRTTNLVRSASPVFARVLGVSQEKAEAGIDDTEEFPAFVHPDDRASYAHAMEEIDREDRAFDLEFRIIRPSDGEVRHVFEKGVPIVDGHGTVVAFRGVLQDVTEKKLVELDLIEAKEQLQKRVAELQIVRERLQSEIQEKTAFAAELEIARDQAQEASRAKSSFLAAMSHEIRTPMTGVLGLSDMLVKTGLSAEQEHLVASIRTSSDGLLEVINDILDQSKIEAGLMELDVTDFDARAVMEQVKSNLNPRAVDKGIGLDVTVDAAVPPWVSGDPTRLRQVVFNLVGNAVKFTEAGRVTVGVAPGEGADVVFTVEDTGVGIPEAAQKRLFEPFHQADSSTSRTFGGSGLGLSISKDIVTLMGGDIGFESTQGTGSRFWFRVALPPVEPPAGADAAEAGRSTAVGRALDILVAEDNEINRMVIGAILTELGHAHRFVVNGKEAIQATDTDRFDLVLMDIRMPEMDGLQAVSRMRREGAPAARWPIVALTADVTTDHIASYKDAGFDAVAKKPIDVQELAQAMDDALAVRAGGPAA